MTRASAPAQAPLSGGMLWAAALILAAANFIAVLDMTIANVSVPNIAGNLGATLNQGTWVITSYAVAEALTVPLTGWLAARYGAVRMFVTSIAAFGLFSLFCGMATSLEMLVAMRVLQGLAGGPMMPLSQTLLMRIFPKEKVGAALGLWAMTTLVAPVLGPILGGYLCDELSWQFIFFINLPLAMACAVVAWRMLNRYEAPLVKSPIDKVGLTLLLVWVSALQLLLDEGKTLDWFASPLIVGLGALAFVGFGAFIIWELYEPHPIVDLKVFRHRGFTVSVVTVSACFGAFFGVNVLTPLWLQNFMGYTATLSGQVMAWSGAVAVFVAPLAAALANKGDPRKLIFAGVAWLGLVTIWRSVATANMDYWAISVPVMVMGLGLPFFFIPLNTLALGSVEPNETASAAGLLNFLRTLSGAVGVSLVSTCWEDSTTAIHAEWVGRLDSSQEIETVLRSTGTPSSALGSMLDQMLTAQSVMVATNQLMLVLGTLMVAAAFIVWLAPKPSHSVAPDAGGH